MVDKISLPVVIPNRVLISPGIWNDNEYTAKEIGEGFARTDWADKTKIALWLNHDDKNTSAFVGYVKNPTLASQGRVFGDLEIWDEKTAINLTQAMAKFGVSAKIKGEENKEGKMMNFSFENFSVVTVPACSEAYINLSEKEKKDKLTSKYLISDKEIDNMLEDDIGTNGKLIDENALKLKAESNLDTIERGLNIDKNMAEEEEKKEEVVEEKVEESKEEPEEKELSEKDLLKSLCEKFDKLVSILSKKELAEEEKPVEPEAEEKVDESTIDPEGDKLLPKEEEKKEEVEKEVEPDKELTAVKKELAEIKAKLNAPKSKTVRNLSSNTVGNNEQFNVDSFCELLGTVDKPIRFK